ncbi:uncharacterized protein DNG_10117 [Cephalotrichum gorgonifer]|uniref:Uncharacterized protein n=1 Tax=Cephalotrichum gorgonifer TaxID=2041049 RepID=A0AAE8T011_9PEZI|nr:uncharacterized protein DNG_10117 [Cephalotrichum gorgonifer]
MSSQALRTQILANAKFLFGPKKNFEIITGLVFIGQYGNIKASQAMLVEISEEDSTFKTHHVGEASADLDVALESLHAGTRKLIYLKVSAGLPDDEMIEPGDNVIEGSLDWD